MIRIPTQTALVKDIEEGIRRFAACEVVPMARRQLSLGGELFGDGLVLVFSPAEAATLARQHLVSQGWPADRLTLRDHPSARALFVDAVWPSDAVDWLLGVMTGGGCSE
jgi:hypothetical protein